MRAQEPSKINGVHLITAGILAGASETTQDR